jgi:hypothetical protein
MRLTERELKTIQETFLEYFDKQDHLWLFGSRTDDAQRGGDIDLYIETNQQDKKEVLSKKLDFIISLKKRIGDQKIDVVINFINDHLSLLVYKIAQETGVQIV